VEGICRSPHGRFDLSFAGVVASPEVVLRVQTMRLVVDSAVRTSRKRIRILPGAQPVDRQTPCVDALFGPL
jgi:hypothetical protein